MGTNPESLSPELSSPLYSEHPDTGGEIPTEEGIRSWLLEAKVGGATHVVIVCDTYDWSDYPIPVMPNEDVHQVVKENDNEERLSKVMEVYWLDGDIEAQLALPLSLTYGPPEEK